ncbi:zinc finger protein 184 [Anopheles cruzii]|uniref:zinc finger protein 184 n=1 Tax=Anopheles cruzii TaxID=68878 RepID=UPI0022EC76C2|nr:zinc finger protein 184 [Anopheles cruzii]
MLHDEDTELDDDTHLCIKCGSTVEGIENYIKHRKVNCSNQTQQQPKSAVVPSVTSGRPEPGPGANLEPGAPAGAEGLRVTTEPASSYGTFDFSEAIKEPDHHKKVPRSAYDYHNYEPQPHHHHHHGPDEDHHQQQQQQQQQDEPEHPGTGADGKSADYKNEVNYEYELGADLFFSSLELQSSSKKSERAPGNATGSKRQVRLRKPQQQQQLPDDWLATSASSSDKLMKAVSDISGHKKPMDLYPIFHQESPEPPTDEDEAVSEEEDDDDEDAPPRTHTGGKWKPENRPSGNLLQRSAHHWRQQWLPPEPDEPETTSCKSFSPPPPGHTKGKWVPGSKQTPRLEDKPRSQVGQYEDQCCWCSICNRRLASRAVYERHLKSQLHLKRAQEESELERTAVRPVELSKQLEESRQESSSQAQPLDQLPRRIPDGAPAKRKRKCYYTKCGVCKTRLPTHLLGKHLISRYHYRRMQNHPQQCWELVLRNMHRIVLQSPFQCQPCRFYANTEPHFMRHWMSDEHRGTVGAPDGGGGKFWCSFCKFECDGNQQMTEHLLGAGHRELIAVINRSVPIIIRRLADIRCGCCGRQFRYNAELRRHQQLYCSATGPEQAAQVCTRVQNTFVCELCGASFPDRIRLLQHGQKLHRLAHYYCSICECSFGTAQESMRHRRTTRHKTMSVRRHRPGQLTPKGCPVCKEQLADILELKQHMHEAHPDVKYSTSSQAEFLFHEILHSSKLDDKAKSSRRAPPPPKLVCPLCGRPFSKASLRCHLRQHTNERLFPCPHCPMAFTRKTNLKSHTDNIHRHLHHHHRKPPIEPTDPGGGPATRHICTTCGKTFANRHALRHEDTDKKYKCDQCEFACRLPGSLKRHLLVHSGQKPFSCPHCDYSCNAIENLRKHVISTARHLGRFLYECKICAPEAAEGSYGTNFQKEYKTHLQECHKMVPEQVDEMVKL